MMKKLMLLCAANLSAMLAFCADDIYYNNKTFSTSESTDGNVYIGPSTASGEALVTVRNGATWNSATNIYLGNAAGTSKLVVESGAVLAASSKGVELCTSIADKADTEIENRGTMNLYNFHMGGKETGEGISVFHNYGTLNVDYDFHLGMVGGKTNVFHFHEGSDLNVTARNEKRWRFYVGATGGDSTMIVDDDIEILHKVWMGMGADSIGRFILNNDAVMTMTGDELRLGYQPDSQGYVLMNNDSKIVGKAVVSVGLGLRSDASFVMSNNTVVAVTNNNGFTIAGGKGSNGLTTLNDNANLLIGTRLVVAGGESSYGQLVLRDNSQIDVKNDFVVGGGVSSTGVVELL